MTGGCSRARNCAASCSSDWTVISAAGAEAAAAPAQTAAEPGADAPGEPAGARRRSGGRDRGRAARGNDALPGNEPADDLRRGIALEAGDDVDRALHAVLEHLDRCGRAAAGDRG